MKHIAHVYGRILFPSRYTPHGDNRNTDGQPATLPADSLDLVIAAGLYRMVSAVEGILDGLRRPARTSRATAEQTPAVTPVGCG